MIKAIVYESKAGHTKRYAEMLSDSCDNNHNSSHYGTEQ